MDNKKVAHISEKRAEQMMMEHVRIRHSMTGIERIVALAEWSKEADRLYRSALPKDVTVGP